MIGQQQILTVRKRNLRPAAIFFEFGRRAPELMFGWRPETAIENGLYPTVWVEPKETSGRHDLRFVQGCNVLVSAPEWSAEFLKFGDELVDAGAKPVTLCAIEECGDIRRYDGEWSSYVD